MSCLIGGYNLHRFSDALGLVLLDVSRTCNLFSKCQADGRSIFSKVEPHVEGMYNHCTGLGQINTIKKEEFSGKYLIS